LQVDRLGLDEAQKHALSSFSGIQKTPFKVAKPAWGTTGMASRMVDVVFGHHDPMATQQAAMSSTGDCTRRLKVGSKTLDQLQDIDMLLS